MTAPAKAAAMKAATRSTLLDDTNATVSPRRRPSSWKPAAMRSQMSSSSAQVYRFPEAASICAEERKRRTAQKSGVPCSFTLQLNQFFSLISEGEVNTTVEQLRRSHALWKWNKCEALCCQLSGCAEHRETIAIRCARVWRQPTDFASLRRTAGCDRPSSLSFFKMPRTMRDRPANLFTYCSGPGMNQIVLIIEKAADCCE